jgi:TonB family protein
MEKTKEREMKKGVWVAVVGAMLLLGSLLLAQDGYKVVVNPGNATASLSREQISKLFSGKAGWDDGSTASPVDQLPTSPVREVFSHDIFGAPASVIAGRGGPGGQPPAVASDRDVLAYVRLKPGAIGYVSASADVQGVRVVSIGKASASTAPAPMMVGGKVPVPDKILDVPPVYPDTARTARLQGSVDLVIVIGPGGAVENARTLAKAPPLLEQAAIAAVKQWKYRPTLVNGVPVPVTMTVRISFAL